MSRTIRESIPQPFQDNDSKCSVLEATRGKSPVTAQPSQDSFFSQPNPSPGPCSVVPSQAERITQARTVPLAESSDFDIVTQFDLNSRFGPCSGLSRLERWERAKRLGLRPPVDVRSCIERVESDALKQFDFDFRFGPYLGISRRERWERAVRLGLEPPAEVKRILLQASDCGTDLSD